LQDNYTSIAAGFSFIVSGKGKVRTQRVFHRRDTEGTKFEGKLRREKREERS
jgi:hypothetical protein